MLLFIAIIVTKAIAIVSLSHAKTWNDEMDTWRWLMPPF